MVPKGLEYTNRITLVARPSDALFLYLNEHRKVKESIFPQISLPLSNATGVDDVADSVLAAKPTFRHAMNLAIEVSGLQDEQIAEFLGVSPGNISKYKSGTYNWPQDQLVVFMELVGNKIPARWLALQVGCSLKPLQTTLEEELEAAKAQIADLERDKKTILEFAKSLR